MKNLLSTVAIIAATMASVATADIPVSADDSYETVTNFIETQMPLIDELRDHSAIIDNYTNTYLEAEGERQEIMAELQSVIDVIDAFTATYVEFGSFTAPEVLDARAAAVEATNGSHNIGATWVALTEQLDHHKTRNLFTEEGDVSSARADIIDLLGADYSFNIGQYKLDIDAEIAEFDAFLESISSVTFAPDELVVDVADTLIVATEATATLVVE